jgi:hypothetical protein
LAGIKGIATAPALGRSGRHSRWFLDDRGRGGNLLVITRLGLWLPKRRIGLHRRSRRDVGLAEHGLTAGSGLRAALKQPQAIFELPVAILQLLILAGELPQLILKLLNPHFRVAVGLREGLRR